MSNQKEKEDFMKRAIELSRIHMENLEGGPFGAVIVKEGKIIAEGWNQVLDTKNPIAHAEVMAIQKASQKLQSFHLKGCEIYTSCLPCPMCLGAIYWSQIDKIYYAATSIDAHNIGFSDDELYKELKLPKEERKIPYEQLLHKEAVEVFHAFENKADKILY